MKNMRCKTYNSHCSKWGKCERRLENDCRGCTNNRKGTMIIFNKVFNENFKRLINNLDKLTNNDWLTIKEYNIMLLIDFVDKYDEFEDCVCYNDATCIYENGEPLSCLKHYLEYYVKNNLS